jgi:tetratricopeptide (TPR) repeat protein
LHALETAATVATQRVEAHTLAALAEALAGGDAEAALARALAEPGFVERLAGGDLSNPEADPFLVRLLWRQQVAPRLGDDEVAGWRERYRQSGGSEGLAWREAGRQRLAVLLVAYVLRVLRGDGDRAEAALAEAVDVYRILDTEWLHDLFGEPRDLETALVHRSGPVEYLTRALEGNEVAAARIGAGQARQRLVAAERGFLALVDGLAARLPERVVGRPGVEVSPGEPGGRERAYCDITGSLARFYQRIGEQEKAALHFDHLIGRLETSATHENRRAWAGYLFDRAAIAMDQHDGASGKQLLARYVKHYDDLLQNVRQFPDRYVNPEAARAFFAAQLATGHISLAVLHNVVLGELEVAREHCRKAYALEDSPFNRVLYACYLARDGRAAEARALITTVEPSLPLYYNLACTLALAGDREQALRYVELDLRWNHPTRKARNRQREWARRDRDLAALRDDPRFIELVRARQEGEER